MLLKWDSNENIFVRKCIQFSFLLFLLFSSMLSAKFLEFKYLSLSFSLHSSLPPFLPLSPSLSLSPYGMYPRPSYVIPISTPIITQAKPWVTAGKEYKYPCIRVRMAGCDTAQAQSQCLVSCHHSTCAYSNTNKVKPFTFQYYLFPPVLI